MQTCEAPRFRFVSVRKSKCNTVLLHSCPQDRCISLCNSYQMDLVAMFEVGARHGANTPGSQVTMREHTGLP